ncbi:MAG TPA: 1-phosphofructokinase family hexose kinase [Novosphingobium sp.]|nr:1-phosphofructokinase family hexose kinase [Novosphingobium sp.]
MKPAALPRVVTLTLNPAIDGSSEAVDVRPTVKGRTAGERFDPGGGGINVARVLERLGTPAEAVCLGGGVTGPLLGGLLERVGLRHRLVPIAGDTRISMVVRERASGLEYRFVPEGPLVSPAECARVLDLVGGLDCGWLVLSGSLPRGVPEDFYARIVAVAAPRGIRVVLDTSGEALKAALAAGGVHLVKPSLEEMEQAVGQPLADPQDLARAASALVARGAARLVAVSRGAQGALLAWPGGVLDLPAIRVEAKSAVGAGDSFVAGMVHALAAGWREADAFRLGVAAGTAAVLTPGTELCHRVDVVRLAEGLGLAAV